MSHSEHRINHEIRVEKVRLIGPQGQQMGIVDLGYALNEADRAGLDLVEVAPDSQPPVCRIMDYSKYLYEQKKKLQEARKKQKASGLKEIRFKPAIDQHDINVKLRHVREFLSDGYKVKLTVIFKGRDRFYPEKGEALLDRILQDLGDVSQVDREKRVEGNRLSVVISPFANKTGNKNKEVGSAEGKGS